MSEYLGCGDSGCSVEKPTGMATNGGCRCLRDVDAGTRNRILKRIHILSNRAKTLTPERVDELCVSYDDADMITDWPSGFMHGQAHLAKLIKQELEGMAAQSNAIRDFTQLLTKV